MQYKRIMALDVGDKTCGVALSDLMGLTAQPYQTLRYQDLQQRKILFGELLKICNEQTVGEIVIGMPLNMNGSAGPQSEKVEGFIHELQNFFRKHKTDPENLKWIYWDERLSTMGAERSLIVADVSREKRKKVIDKMAATFILQGYLESQRLPDFT